MRSSTQQTVQSPLIVHVRVESYHWPHAPDAICHRAHTCASRTNMDGVDSTRTDASSAKTAG